VAVLNPFAVLLADVGVPIERAFRDVDLPPSVLENLNNYVPSERFFAFVAKMAREEGIEDLGFHVGKRFGANCADPHMADLLRQSPTMFHGLSMASDLTNRTITRCRLGLMRSPNASQTYFYHLPSCQYGNAASHDIAWFGVMTLLGMARVYAGPDWRPAEIGVMSRRNPAHHIFEYLPNTRIRLGQQCSYIALPHAAIARPPTSAGFPEAVRSSKPYIPFENSMVGSLKQVLRAYVSEDISLPMAAELCNMSGRTLQRQLKKRATSFRKVLDEVRFEIARGMLADSDTTGCEIGRLVGYEHATDFSRAFRRVAGLSPTEFRRAYSKNAGIH